MAVTREIAQLLLQVDASVALAQRNITSLAQSVDGQSSKMEQSLGRVDKAFARNGTSAASSAQVFMEGRAAADALIGSIDPLYAAQVRYDRELEKAQALQRQGQLTAAEFARVQVGLKAALDDQVMAYGGLGKGIGTTRIAQMEMMHVVRGSVDQFAAGASMTQIFAMHVGMLGQAAAMSGNSMGKFGAFMGGPWGIAMVAGISILSTLILKHHDAGDSVDALVAKMRKQASEALNQKSANDIWAKSIDGVREAQEKLRKELEDSLKTEGMTRQQHLDNAQAALAQQRQALSAKEAERNQLQQQVGAFGAIPVSGGSVPGAAAAAQDAVLAELTKKLADAKRDVAQLKKDIADSQRTITDAQLVIANNSADASAKATTAIQHQAESYRGLVNAAVDAGHVTVAAAEQARIALDKYTEAQDAAAAQGLNIAKIGADKQIRALSLSFSRGKADVNAYASALTQATSALNKAATAAAAAKKATGELGKQISFDDAAAIAKGAGLTVTSAYRSTAHQAELYNDPNVRRPGNPVARPGTSAHEGINGKWALDIAFAPGLTADKLKKLYGDQGVSLSAVFKEKGHFHIEGSRSNAAAAEAQAKRGELAGIHQQGAFDQANDRLDQELAQAKQQLTGDYHQLAELANKQVDAETQKLVDSIQEQEALGLATGYQQGITEAQGRILLGKAQELSEDKKALIAKRELDQTLSDQRQAADQFYQFQVDDLHFADEMAMTQSEHRRLQLQILDIVYEQKRLDLDYAKAQAERNGNLAEANRIQVQIGQLPADKARDQARVHNGTLDPLEQWAKSVPQTAAQINEALHSIEAQGLDRLASSMTELVMGTKSLGAAFSDVARSIIGEIVAMTIKMLVFRALSSALGGAFGGGFDSAGFASTEASNAASLGISGFRAGGGPVSAGQAYVVGEHRPEVFVPSTSGTILPSIPRVGAPSAGNGGRGTSEVVVHVFTDENFHASVRQTAGQVVIEAAPTLVRASAQATTRSLQRPRLMGGK